MFEYVKINEASKLSNYTEKELMSMISNKQFDENRDYYIRNNIYYFSKDVMCNLNHKKASKQNNVKVTVDVIKPIEKNNVKSRVIDTDTKKTKRKFVDSYGAMNLLKCSVYNLQDYRRGYKTKKVVNGKNTYKYNEPILKKDEDWFKKDGRIFYYVTSLKKKFKV